MPGGPLLISLIYMIATLLFLPGSLIQIGIGFTLVRAYDSKPSKGDIHSILIIIKVALSIGGPVVLIGSQSCATI